MSTDHTTFDFSPDEFRALGHQVIELMQEAITAEQTDPVLRPVTGGDLRLRLDEPLPENGCDAEQIIQQWREDVLPYCRRNGHPRFFGYVCTSADPIGMLADAVASAMNQPVTAWRSAPSATEVERLVVRWLDQLTGFGGEDGMLVSGGSSANFHGMACAVTRAEQNKALPPGSRHRLTVYISREGHFSMKKALCLLGLPPDNIRLLDIDEERRMRSDELQEKIEQDMKAGFVPTAVCVSAGTANTGAIDPLDEVADICEKFGLWLHVDGSYGAPAVITSSYGWMGETFARADSLSLDPHKWLFVSADAGCILVRDANIAQQTFSLSSEYTAVTQTDPIERYAFFDSGLELSRRFRGLKVWTILKMRGMTRLRAAIQHDIDLRYYLDKRISSSPDLDPLGSELSISCFRYHPGHISEVDKLNEINKTILETLVREGKCYMSPTELDGAYALRVCIVNFRTRQEDINFLVNEILRIGHEITGVS